MKLEPLPELTGAMMTLRSAQFPDPSLSAAVRDFDARVRATKSGDRYAWPYIYYDAIALVERVLTAQAELDRSQADLERLTQVRRTAAEVGGLLQSLQGKLSGDWASRLQAQERELAAKVKRSVDRLDIEAVEDDRRGETIYRPRQEDLVAFQDWLRTSIERWAFHNAVLASNRANDAAEDAFARLPSEISFRFEPVVLDPIPPPDLQLKGHAIPTPKALELLSTTWKATTTGFGSVATIGFIVPRIVGASAAVTQGISIFLGVALVLAAGFAFLTVPKQTRQARERVTLRAESAARQEILDEAKALVHAEVDRQTQMVRRYLSQETQRYKALERSLPAGPRQASLLGAPSGLGPQDRARLAGETRQAIDRHLRALVAEIWGAAPV